jgi:CRISP-associated protein Cas1
MTTTLYLTEPGTVVRYRNESLVIVHKQQSKTRRLTELSLVVVLPGVQFTEYVLDYEAFVIK